VAHEALQHERGAEDALSEAGAARGVGGFSSSLSAHDTTVAILGVRVLYQHAELLEIHFGVARVSPPTKVIRSAADGNAFHVAES
jgi:hypothetical protein